MWAWPVSPFGGRDGSVRIVRMDDGLWVREMYWACEDPHSFSERL